MEADTSIILSRARDGLPLDLLARLRCAVAAHAENAGNCWKAFCVKVIDGTGINIPNTQENQRTYPPARGQKRGCDFPFMKVGGGFSLATGALLDYTQGNKHQHELNLFHGLLDQFQPGDLALADRGFSFPAFSSSSSSSLYWVWLRHQPRWGFRRAKSFLGEGLGWCQTAVQSRFTVSPRGSKVALWQVHTTRLNS